MSPDFVIRAPAKVNIGLRVLPERGDGFHGIESIFQTVDVCDELTVSPLAEKNRCVVECDTAVLPACNTLTATYAAFCQLTGCDAGVHVCLRKRIPMGGGLGGGSSDAAAFLRALAKVHDVPLTDDLADAVAGQVGSDVFFFLHCGKDGTGAALVSGRGDLVRSIAPRTDVHFVLVFPDVHSSTKEAYRLVDEDIRAGNVVSCPDFSAYEAIYRRSVSHWTFANSFTAPLEKKYPVIAQALADIKKSGAVWSDMTGSGAVVFGVYEAAEASKEAFAKLNRTWRSCFLA
ncbi:MAG: 4-(cytidine 5'-diphospho)-2-C-methyl-D-erythritol kinase [Treponemataceae bacterium]|nr:4-(cytidine 5'-diphospho)-2-C-methyl-D-erythritol kinase [Treponemataceae bacterium]